MAEFQLIHLKFVGLFSNFELKLLQSPSTNLTVVTSCCIYTLHPPHIISKHPQQQRRIRIKGAFTYTIATALTPIMIASRGDNTNSRNHPPVAVHINNCNNVSVTNNSVNNSESFNLTMNSNQAQPPIAGGNGGDGNGTGEEAEVGATCAQLVHHINSGDDGKQGRETKPADKPKNAPPVMRDSNGRIEIPDGLIPLKKSDIDLEHAEVFFDYYVYYQSHPKFSPELREFLASQKDGFKLEQTKPYLENFVKILKNEHDSFTKLGTEALRRWVCSSFNSWGFKVKGSAGQGPTTLLQCRNILSSPSAKKACQAKNHPLLLLQLTHQAVHADNDDFVDYVEAELKAHGLKHQPPFYFEAKTPNKKPPGEKGPQANRQKFLRHTIVKVAMSGTQEEKKYFQQAEMDAFGASIRVRKTTKYDNEKFHLIPKVNLSCESSNEYGNADDPKDKSDKRPYVLVKKSKFAGLFLNGGKEPTVKQIREYLNKSTVSKAALEFAMAARASSQNKQQAWAMVHSAFNRVYSDDMKMDEFVGPAVPQVDQLYEFEQLIGKDLLENDQVVMQTLANKSGPPPPPGASHYNQPNDNGNNGHNQQGLANHDAPGHHHGHSQNQPRPSVLRLPRDESGLPSEPRREQFPAREIQPQDEYTVNPPGNNQQGNDFLQQNMTGLDAMHFDGYATNDQQESDQLTHMMNMTAEMAKENTKSDCPGYIENSDAAAALQATRNQPTPHDYTASSQNPPEQAPATLEGQDFTHLNPTYAVSYKRAESKRHDDSDEDSTDEEADFLQRAGRSKATKAMNEPKRGDGLTEVTNINPAKESIPAEVRVHCIDQYEFLVFYHVFSPHNNFFKEFTKGVQV